MAAIRKLCLLDDNLMTLVFDRNIEATEFLLNVILQRNDLKVLEAVAQREYKNPMSDGRSITIDIYTVDRNDKVYDIEVQRASKGADMCQVFEDLAEKRVVEKIAEEKKASARRMITKGKLTVEEIAEYTDLPVEEIRDLAKLQLA